MLNWITMTTAAIGRLMSALALWRVEVRDREARRRAYLDRAEQCVSQLFACCALGIRANESIRNGQSLPEGEWDYSPPVLPEGELNTPLVSAADACRLLHHETMNAEMVSPERMQDALLKVAAAHKALKTARGKW